MRSATEHPADVATAPTRRAAVPLRILVVTTSYPRVAGDLAGCFVAEWCSALAARGHLLQVVAPKDGADEEYAPYGVPVERVRYAGRPRLCYGDGIPDNIRHDPLSALQLPGLVGSFTFRSARVARAFQPDVVVSHWAGPATVVGWAVSRLCGARHVAVLHSEGPLRARLAAPLADQLVSVSGQAGPRVQVVPLGVTELVAPTRKAARQRLGIEPGRFTILALGRQVRVKGYDRLPDTAPHGSVLLLCGDGPEHAALKRAAARAMQRGVDVRLPGTVLAGDKADVLAAADVFVAPSRFDSGRTEGLPISVREAQRAGLPVVASDVGGLRFAVRHEADGVLVPDGDRRRLAAVLAWLQADPSWRRRLGAEAQRATRRLTWPRVAPLWETALREAV